MGNELNQKKNVWAQVDDMEPEIDSEDKTAHDKHGYLLLY